MAASARKRRPRSSVSSAAQSGNAVAAAAQAASTSSGVASATLQPSTPVEGRRTARRASVPALLPAPAVVKGKVLHRIGIEDRAEGIGRDRHQMIDAREVIPPSTVKIAPVV